MKLIIILILLIGMVGCGTKTSTIHDYCTDPNHLAHYQSYQECYDEVSQTHANIGKPNVLQKTLHVVGAGLAGGGQALSNQPRTQNQSTNCQTVCNSGYCNTTCN